MPSANECLKWCKPLVAVMEARLENTLAGDWADDDVPGGVASVVAGVGASNPRDNSLVRLAYGRAYNSGATETVIDGIQYQRSLGEPFKSGASVSQSKMFIDHLASNDQLYFRDWERRNYVFKVGGRYKPNSAEDEVLRYGDYPTWTIGRITGKDFDERQMGIFFSAESPELERLFPESLVTSGANRDQVIPFVVGHVRSMAPLETSETTGIYHDGECEGIVTAYDQDGNELTLESGDPLTDMVSGSDKYIADNLGNVAWHPDVTTVRLEVKGMKVDGVFTDKANEIIAELVKRITNDIVQVNHSFDGKPIGWVFAQQDQIKNQISLLLNGLDCFYSQDEATNSITIKRRYNARNTDLDGNPNVTDSFSFGQSDGFNKRFKQIRPISRPRRVVVRYNKNFAPISKTELAPSSRELLGNDYDYVSESVFDGYADTLFVDCALSNQSDAEDFVSMLSERYSIKAHYCSWEEQGVGFGVFEGDVGVLQHRLVRQNVFTEVRKFTQDIKTKITAFEGVIYG